MRCQNEESVKSLILSAKLNRKGDKNEQIRQGI